MTTYTAIFTIDAGSNRVGSADYETYAIERVEFEESSTDLFTILSSARIALIKFFKKQLGEDCDYLEEVLNDWSDAEPMIFKGKLVI